MTHCRLSLGTRIMVMATSGSCCTSLLTRRTLAKFRALWPISKQVEGLTALKILQEPCRLDSQCKHNVVNIHARTHSTVALLELTVPCHVSHCLGVSHLLVMCHIGLSRVTMACDASHCTLKSWFRPPGAHETSPVMLGMQYIMSSLK